MWFERDYGIAVTICVSPRLPVYNSHSYKDVLCTFYFKLWILGVLGRTS